MTDNSSINAELIKNKISSILKSKEPLVSEEELRFWLLLEIADYKIDDSRYSLEFPFKYENTNNKSCNGKVDAILWDKDSDKGGIAFEFKYAHNELVSHGKKLSPQSGTRTNNRYNFLKDIYRLEHIIDGDKEIKVTSGYAIFLTNIDAYWKENENQETEDSGVSISDGVTFYKDTPYGYNTESNQKYNTKIKLRSDYTIEWEDIEGSDFRCCIVKVGPKE